MKALRLLVTGFFTTLLIGCVPSLNPLFTAKDLIFETSLLGNWEIDNEVWSFSKLKENQYKLTHSDNDNQASFSAHLEKIKEEMFLDISPLDYKSNNYLYQTHLFPVHTFSKIKIKKDLISLQMIDPESLEQAILQKKTKVAHVVTQDGRILLTATTQDLQDFIISDVTIFEKKRELIRKK